MAKNAFSRMFEAFGKDIKEYKLPFGWYMSFPRSWKHERVRSEDDSQDLFFPKDKNDDFTFRVTPLSVRRDGEDAPASEVLPKDNVPEGAVRRNDVVFAPNFISSCYEQDYTENGENIHKLTCLIATDGNLLVVNIYSADKQRIEQAPDFARYVRRNA